MKQQIKELQDKLENVAISHNFDLETTIDIDDTLSKNQLTPLEVGDQGFTI